MYLYNHHAILKLQAPSLQQTRNTNKFLTSNTQAAASHCWPVASEAAHKSSHSPTSAPPSHRISHHSVRCTRPDGNCPEVRLRERKVAVDIRPAVVGSLDMVLVDLLIVDMQVVAVDIDCTFAVAAHSSSRCVYRLL